MPRKKLTGEAADAQREHTNALDRARYHANISESREKGRVKANAGYHRRKQNPEWREENNAKQRERRAKPAAKAAAHGYYERNKERILLAEKAKRDAAKALRPPRPPTPAPDPALEGLSAHARRALRDPTYKARRVAQEKARRAANPQKYEEKRKKQYVKSKEKAIAKATEWNKKNPDKRKKTVKKWDANNRDARRAKDARRRARELGAPGSYDKKDIEWLFKQQKGKCAECKKPLGKKFHVDHKIPITKGGSNDRRNLQLLHGPCNQQKGALDPIVFARKKGRLL